MNETLAAGTPVEVETRTVTLRLVEVERALADPAVVMRIVREVTVLRARTGGLVEALTEIRDQPHRSDHGGLATRAVAGLALDEDQLIRAAAFVVIGGDS